MTPPKFSDLNKIVKDLFEEYFDFGKIKCECKFKTVSGLDVSVAGDHDYLLGSAGGILKMKHKSDANDLAVMGKYSSATNEVISELEIGDSYVKGLKQNFEIVFHSTSGFNSVGSKTNFYRDCFNLNVDSKFTSPMPKINTGLVMGLLGNSILGGVSLTLDSKKRSILQHSFAISYRKDDLILSSKVTNRSDLEACVYQRVSPNLESGVQMSWTPENRSTLFGLCGRYQRAERSFFKVKVDTNALVGLAYSIGVDAGVTVTMSGEIDLSNLIYGGHRIGLRILFDY